MKSELHFKLHPSQSNVKHSPTYLILATNIPNGETNVFVLHGLHIESWIQEQDIGTKCMYNITQNL